MPRQKSTHVDDPRAVGRRLRDAREKAGLSQRQLAFPGCSPAYISRIKSGDRIPSLQLLRELGRRLGVTEDWLATGSEDGRAHIELDRGQADEALRVLEEGRPLLESHANPVEQAQYQLEEARALAKLGRNEEAAALAMQISGLISDAHPEDAARSYTVLGSVFEELGDNARAQELYELAAELLKPRNPNRFLVEVYSRLADIAEREDRKEEAYEYMKKAIG